MQASKSLHLLKMMGCYAAIILPVVCADQFVKHLIRTHMLPGEAIPGQDHFIRLFYTLNDGVSFSFLSGAGRSIIAIQSILVVILLGALLVMAWKSAPLPPSICLSFMLGGGIGNLVDRIRTGEVTDFIAVGSFPVFNLADSALTVGCLILILWLIRSEFRAKKLREDENAVH
jgi:signal peptidase II